MTTHANHREKHSRRPIIIGVSIVAVLCLGTAGVLAATLHGAPRPVRPTFESLVPSSAGAVLSLSPSAASWKLISATDAPLALGVLAYSKLPAKPVALGAALASAKDTAGRTEVYLDFDNHKAATGAAAWLDGQPGNGQRATAVRGSSVLVTDPTAAGLSAVASFPNRKASEAGDLRADLATRFAKPDRLWLDFDRLDATISTPADAKRRSVFESFESKALGIEKGTRWIGATADITGAWSGDFTSGGYDTSKLAPSDAAAALLATQTTVSGSTSHDDSTGAVSVQAAGMSNLLAVTSINYKTGISRVDKAPLSGPSGIALPSYLPQKAEVSAVIPTTEWIATASGLTAEGQGISSLALSMNLGKLTVGLIQATTAYSLPDTSSLKQPTGDVPSTSNSSSLVPAPAPSSTWKQGDLNPVASAKPSGKGAASSTKPGAIVDQGKGASNDSSAISPIPPGKLVAPAPAPTPTYDFHGSGAGG